MKNQIEATITEKWLNGTTMLEEVDGWEPGDRCQQYHAITGYRCNCGDIYRVGQKVSVTRGTLADKPHVWATCGNCGNLMF